MARQWGDDNSFQFPVSSTGNGHNSDSIVEKGMSHANGQSLQYNVGGMNGNGGLRRRPELQNTMNVVLRLLTFAGCLAGFVVMLTNKQKTTVPVVINGTVVRVPASAKWHYSSAFVWFVIASAVVAVYSLISILIVTLLTIKKSASRPTFLLWAIFIMDIVTMNILMSALAASIAVGLIGKYGNDHVQWTEICDNFGWFCDHVIGAIIASCAGFLALIQSCILDAYHLSIQYGR